MGYFLDISKNKNLTAKDTALRNEMAGITNHSPVGYVLSTNATSIFGSVLNLFDGSKKSTVEDDGTENYDTKTQTNNINEFNKILSKFNSDKSYENAVALQKIYENTDNATIMKYYPKTEVDKVINKSKS